jgi:hypothetical protein
MTIRQQVVDSLKTLMLNPKHVFLDKEILKEKAKIFLTTVVPAWDNDLQFVGTPEQTAQYYFFLDSTNFCFWAMKGEERWAYDVEGKYMSGYYAYSRAIKDAFTKYPQLFDASYLSSISFEDFKNIFQVKSTKNTLLLLDERHAIIKENFSILKEKFDGQAINLIKQSGKDAGVCVEIILKYFPSFRDTVEYEGQKYLFLKRAQIFPSDISFTGIPELRLRNLDHLTVFADYKLPQLFESLGIFNYSEELNSEIINEMLIPAGSLKEMELRASSIMACEIMREELVHLGRNITTHELDWILWVEAKKTTFSKPHHKALTVFY